MKSHLWGKKIIGDEMVDSYIFFPTAEQYTLSNEWKSLVIIFNIFHHKLKKHSAFVELIQYILSNEWKTLIIIFKILPMKLQKHSIFKELMQCNFDHYEASDTMPIVIKIYD